MPELVMCQSTTVDRKGRRWTDAEPLVVVVNGGMLRLELDDGRALECDLDDFEVAFGNEQLRQIGRAA